MGSLEVEEITFLSYGAVIRSSPRFKNKNKFQLPMVELSLTPAKYIKGTREIWGHFLLLGPLVLFLCVFFLYPLSGLLIQSIFDPELTGKHYLNMVKFPVYFQVFWNTIEITITVTLICLLLSYPVAYYLNASKSAWTVVLLVSIMLPFWISVLVRTYTWMVILGRYGVLNELLINLGLIEVPLKLMYNRLGVYVGMVYVMLPFGVLPILSVMQGIDSSLVKAAANLGSTPWQSFRYIFFPLSLPGVGAALLLTFIRSSGFFVTPALMGGRQDTMIAMSIETHLEEIIDWGFASALSVVLLVVILIFFFIYNKYLGIDMLLGGKGKSQYRAPIGEGIAEGRALRPGLIHRVKNLIWNEERSFALEKNLLKIHEFISEIRIAVSRSSPKFIRTVNWNKVGINVICIMVFIFMIGPVVIIIPMGFSNETMIHFPPEEWGLRLFKEYFYSKNWMRTTLNSFHVAIQVMFLAAFLGTLASLSLVRGKYLGKQYWYCLILSPMIIPVIVTAISIYFLFAKLKLIGTITALVIAHTILAVPYVVVVMTSTLKGFDESLEQASMNLGAGRVRTFFHVTFPIIRPGVLTAALFAFIASFDELIGAMFISGVRAKTLPVQMWDGIRDEINPTISAVATLLIFLTIFIMLLVFILRRHQKRHYAK